MSKVPAEKLAADIIREKFNNYNENILIAVSGPGGSGKSTFAAQLKNELNDSSILNLDDYRLARAERRKNILGSNPEASNINLLLHHLSLINQNISFEKPVYNPVSGLIDSHEYYSPKRFNIIDGEISTCAQIIDTFNIIILINSSLLNQFITRIKRDSVERKYSFFKSLAVFVQSNLIDFNKFNKHAGSIADIIVNSNGSKFMMVKFNK